MSDRLALANAIEDGGIPRDKAERMASVIVDLVRDTAATRAGVQSLGAELLAEIATTRTDLRAEIAAVHAEVHGEMAVRFQRLPW
jgi:hypothetical protein